MKKTDLIINYNDAILITGSNGFIGSRIVKSLLSYGYKNLKCFVETLSNFNNLDIIINSYSDAKIEIIQGNLLSSEDCDKATEGVSVIFHLAAGFGKSFTQVYRNSVITTKNLLESTLKYNKLKRFLNVSSFAVYSNKNIERGGLLDEKCEVEKQPEKSGEAYCYGKVKQEEILLKYNKKYNIPFVIVRPGVVFGPGKAEISGRVGIWAFGIFLHLGGSNRIPFTYVDNCAEAIVLAGLKNSVDGEVFNIVDDDLPTSRVFLNSYKKGVRYFPSVYIPYWIMYCLCYIWEKCSEWSGGRLPLLFNRRRCRTDWKGNRYSNQKLKDLLGWRPKITFEEGSKHFFEYWRNYEEKHD